MVSLDWETTAAGDATLVTVALESDDSTRVRVANCLDGPVWPPRRQGVPAAGWDEDGFAGVVDGRRVLGYACPADPADPPVRIVEERPPDDADGGLSPRDLVRQLGDPAPPTDAVGPPADPSDAGSEPSKAPGADRPPGASGTPRGAASGIPPAVAAWLDRIERRLADADRLASATSVSEASDAVAAVGGPEAVRALRARLAADQAALAAVATRAEALATEAETVEIPVETLAELA